MNFVSGKNLLFDIIYLQAFESANKFSEPLVRERFVTENVVMLEVVIKEDIKNLRLCNH